MPPVGKSGWSWDDQTPCNRGPTLWGERRSMGNPRECRRRSGQGTLRSAYLRNDIGQESAYTCKL
jgi:hypothetical protein